MFRLYLIGDKSEQVNRLSAELSENRLTCSIISSDDNIVEQIHSKNPDLVLIVAEQLQDTSMTMELVDSIKQKKPLAAIALLSRETLGILGSGSNIDDFVLAPWEADEVIARVKRVLRRNKLIDNGELIRCGDLMIDRATCEVSISGKLIELTFKEYELLIFLASNRGRVFTREILLDKVWGYDYFGGDRTVDVHIRRLRSKIEDANHSFIETVRNIGYKFKKDT